MFNSTNNNLRRELGNNLLIKLNATDYNTSEKKIIKSNTTKKKKLLQDWNCEIAKKKKLIKKLIIAESEVIKLKIFRIKFKFVDNFNILFIPFWQKKKKGKRKMLIIHKKNYLFCTILHEKKS